MAFGINQDEGDYGKIRKFARLSRKVTGTNLNRVPGASTDSFDDKGLLRAVKGLAHGMNFDERVNTKPLKVRKVTKGTGGESKLTRKKPSTRRPKVTTRRVNRYK